MTDKEVLEVIRKEFKGKAYNDEEECQYKFEDKKCIAGCFIPDELYNPDFENNSIGTLINNQRLDEDIFPLNTTQMAKWQDFHDCALDFEASVLDQQNALFNRYMELK